MPTEEPQLSASTLEKLTAALARAPDIVQEELARAMTSLTSNLEREITDHYFPRSTARKIGDKVVESVRHTADGTFSAVDLYEPAGVLGMVSNPSPVALFIEEGTRPHEIRPKGGMLGAQALAFPLGMSGAVGFARVVKHPGTKPQHVFRKALEAHADEIAKEMDAAVQRITERIFDR